MLKRIAKRAGGPGGIYAIVGARYNPRYTNALVKSAKRELEIGGAERVEVVRVPGAFEVPVVARALALANQPKFDAIICIGAILRGATTHAQQIADAVSQALADLQVAHGVPLIHAVLLFEDIQQAEERCFGTEHNRGIEAGRVALEMGRTMRGLGKYRSGGSEMPRAGAR